MSCRRCCGAAKTSKHEIFIERCSRHRMRGAFRDRNHFFQACSAAAANTLDPNQRAARRSYATLMIISRSDPSRPTWRVLPSSAEPASVAPEGSRLRRRKNFRKSRRSGRTCARSSPICASPKAFPSSGSRGSCPTSLTSAKAPSSICSTRLAASGEQPRHPPKLCPRPSRRS
jgi:hypothetical protein